MTHSHKAVFFVSLALNACLFLGCMFLFVHFDGPQKLKEKFSPKKALSNWEMNSYLSQCSIFSMLPQRRGTVVFIGNSILANCPWYELFGSAQIQNRAIGGDGTEGVLKRLDEILRHDPAMLVLGIGRSDIVFGLSYDSIIHNINSIVSAAKQRNTNVDIVMLSEMPWRPDVVASRLFKNANVHELNRRIKRYAEENKLHFVDFASLVSTSDGALDTAYTFDGVHPNGAALMKLKIALDPFVTGILAKSPEKTRKP